MNNDHRPTSSPAVAGSLLIAAVLACALAGLALGELIGAPVILGLLGLFAGVPVGILLVRARFRDL